MCDFGYRYDFYKLFLSLKMMLFFCNDSLELITDFEYMHSVSVIENLPFPKAQSHDYKTFMLVQ